MKERKIQVCLFFKCLNKGEKVKIDQVRKSEVVAKKMGGKTEWKRTIPS